MSDAETAEGLRVEVERSGGFAGVTRRAAVDAAALPPDAAREVAALVAQADLPGLAQALAAAPPPRGPDRFQYDVTVEQGDQRVTLSLPETAVTPGLRRLLERVNALAAG